MRSRPVDDVEESRTLPFALTSAAIARDALLESLSGQDVEDKVVEESVAVMSELVTNAIQHASPVSPESIRVHWTLRRGIVEIDVGDGGAQTEPKPAPLAPWSSSGRGLRIVRSYAHEWGVVDGPRGRVIWAALGGPSRRRTR